MFTKEYCNNTNEFELTHRADELLYRADVLIKKINKNFIPVQKKRTNVTIDILFYNEVRKTIKYLYPYIGILPDDSLIKIWRILPKLAQKYAGSLQYSEWFSYTENYNKGLCVSAPDLTPHIETLLIEADINFESLLYYDMGCHYYDGCEVEQSFEKALEYYKKSADYGSTDAQSAVGNHYYKGNGVPKNYDLAVKWYKKAASKGHQWAQFNLGACYYYGHGVSKNQGEAIKLFTKSAKQGNIDARNWLLQINTGSSGIPFISK